MGRRRKSDSDARAGHLSPHGCTHASGKDTLVHRSIFETPKVCKGTKKRKTWNGDHKYGSLAEEVSISAARCQKTAAEVKKIQNLLAQAKASGPTFPALRANGADTWESGLPAIEVFSMEQTEQTLWKKVVAIENPLPITTLRALGGARSWQDQEENNETIIEISEDEQSDYLLSPASNPQNKPWVQGCDYYASNEPLDSAIKENVHHGLMLSKFSGCFGATEDFIPNPDITATQDDEYSGIEYTNDSIETTDPVPQSVNELGVTLSLSDKVIPVTCTGEKENSSLQLTDDIEIVTVQSTIYEKQVCDLTESSEGDFEILGETMETQSLFQEVQQCESPIMAQEAEEMEEEPDVDGLAQVQQCESPIMAQEDEEIEEEPDVDGLAQLWNDMSFSLVCAKEQKGAEKNLQLSTLFISEKNHPCDHSFLLRDDVGFVCDSCGLIGKSIEAIFDFVWAKARRRKQQQNEVRPNDLGASSEDLVGILAEKKTDAKLTLDPFYKCKMHKHQLDGYQFLQRNITGEEPGGCILAHAPGTGKSFLAISFLHSFLKAHPNHRPLIIAPKGMLLPWIKEFKKWEVEEIPVLNLYDANTTAKVLQETGDVGENLSKNSSNAGLHRWNQLQVLKEWQGRKSVLFVGYTQFSSLVSDRCNTSICLESRKLLLEGPGIIILDEGHFPRNKDTKILDCLMQVHTKQRVLLSGTLFQNNFEELFNLLKLVRPDFMGSKRSCMQGLLEALISKSAFVSTETENTPLVKMSGKKYNREAIEKRIFQEILGQKIQFGSREERRNAVFELRCLTKSFVHWYKGQVLDQLPGLVDFTIMLKLTPAQQEALASLQNMHLNRMDKDIKSRLACIHPSLLKIDLPSVQPSSKRLDALEEDHSCFWQDYDLNMKADEDPRDGVKAKFVMDILNLCQHVKEKMVVFSQYLPPLCLLEKMLMKHKGWFKGQQILRLDGATILEEREALIEKFNWNSDAKILVASIRACGEGISLVGASRVIILDLPWNPAVTRQAISRAFRIGQKKKVYVYRLVAAGTLEEEIYRASVEKEWLGRVIFDDGSEHESFEANFHEVNAQLHDEFFESPRLKDSIVKVHQNNL